MSAAIVKSPRHQDIGIGANIRRLRLMRAMSQEKLAEQLGITFQQVQKYEKGTNRVSGSRIVQLTQALGCGLGDLFQGVTAETNEAPALPPLSLQAIEIARLFDDLPHTQRRAFRNLLASMAGHDAPQLIAAE